MSRPERAPSDVQRDRILSILALSCFSYTIWFCVADLWDRPLNWSAVSTLAPMSIISAGLAGFLYIAGSWRFLKHPEYHRKHQPLDQLAPSDRQVVRAPLLARIPGLYALVVYCCVAALMLLTVIDNYGDGNLRVESTLQVQVLLLLPTSALAAVLLMRTLFKKRVKPNPARSSN